MSLSHRINTSMHFKNTKRTTTSGAGNKTNKSATRLMNKSTTSQGTPNLVQRPNSKITNLARFGQQIRTLYLQEPGSDGEEHGEARQKGRSGGKQQLESVTFF